MRRALLLSLSFALTGALAVDATEIPKQLTAPGFDGPVIARVHQTTASIYDDLKSFVCDEHIERYRGAPDGSHSKSIDVVNAALSFENGTEQYSNIFQNSARRESMASLSGAWSEGEFGSLLRQTGELLDSEAVTFAGTSDESGVSLATYSFDTVESESPWELVIGTRAYRVPFRTEISVAVATGQIVRIARRTLELRPEIGISQIDWSVSLRPTRLQGSDWVLPANAEYVVSYANRKRREWNSITFDHYRRYGAEVALRFEGQ